MSSSTSIIDVDVHHQFSSADALDPYLDDPRPWKDHLERSMGTAGVPAPGGAFRRDALLTDRGPVPGSDPQALIEDHLDRYDLEHVILSPGSTLGLSGLADVDLSTVIARATNDWTVNEWLAFDRRLLGTVLVAARDPSAAAEEIRRLSAIPRMVQATINASPTLLGNSFMYPIYEACEEGGIPLNLHVGGGDVGINPGSYIGGALGKPSTFCEHHFGMCIPAIQNLVSMVTEGVFVKYPKLRFTFNEFGVAWLPFVMWRLDMEYRSNREDVPWLTRLPSEYIWESVRFSTQPLEMPQNPKDLISLLSAMGGDHFLMFSSDYPHWDFDSPQLALKGFPDDWKTNIYGENARAFYNLTERLARDELATATAA
jgi:predicted TIM-barrel fold metal-dependent hydrolase